tara:strand:+ start:97 stop:579 length:483 start_codon:yes stop_codon:yes gene_type:complete
MSNFRHLLYKDLYCKPDFPIWERIEDPDLDDNIELTYEAQSRKYQSELYDADKMFALPEGRKRILQGCNEDDEAHERGRYMKCRNCGRAAFDHINAAERERILLREGARLRWAKDWLKLQEQKRALEKLIGSDRYTVKGEQENFVVIIAKKRDRSEFEEE